MKTTLISALAWLASFLITILTLVAAHTAAGLLGISEKSSLRWTPVVFVLSLAPGGIILWRWALFWNRMQKRDADAAKEMEAKRQEVAMQELREALQNIPDLARYAQLVDASSYRIRSVDDARKIEARVAELARNPAWAKYAERVFRGEYISNEMISYWENPALPLLCEHLRPMEADLRRAVPGLMPLRQGVSVYLNLGFAELQRRYDLPAHVVFEEHPNYRDGGGIQRLRCRKCPCEVTGEMEGPAFPSED